VLVSRKIQHTAELDCRQRGLRLSGWAQSLRRNRDFSFNHFVSRGQAHSRAANCCQDQVFPQCRSVFSLPLPLSVPLPFRQGHGQEHRPRGQSAQYRQLVLSTGVGLTGSSRASGGIFRIVPPGTGYCGSILGFKRRISDQRFGLPSVFREISQKVSPFFGT
jgi:hypothetical protein